MVAPPEDGRHNGVVPELPEVDALAAYLSESMTGSAINRIEVTSFSVLKTYDPPVEALEGKTVRGVKRHGKFVDLDVSGLHVIIHFARAGWLRWSEKLPDTALRVGSGPIAARFRLDGGGRGFDLTEAGSHKGLALYVVRSPRDVPGIAALGPDALSPGIELPVILRRSMQLKRLLRDQTIVAGIGNAYSDEILHAARLSPFAIAANLDDDEIGWLAEAIQSVLGASVAAARGKPPAALKDDKRTRMRVHGRTGEACTVCADVIREVAFSDSSLQYCPGCQTAGKLLKDRSTSKFLK